MTQLVALDWEAYISKLNTLNIIGSIEDTDIETVIGAIHANAGMHQNAIEHGIYLWLEYIMYSNSFSDVQKPPNLHMFLSHPNVTPAVHATLDYLFAQRPQVPVIGWYTSLRLSDHISSSDSDDSLLRYHYAMQMVDALMECKITSTELNTAACLILYVTEHGHETVREFIKHAIRTQITHRQTILSVRNLTH